MHDGRRCSSSLTAANLLLIARAMFFFAPVYAPVLLALLTAGGGERVTVYSVTGCRCDCCSARGLPGVDSFCVIGASDAEIVVIVAHGFTLDGLYALQVTDKVFDYLLHPLMAATGALVLGETGDRLYIAATSLMALYALPLRGQDRGPGDVRL